MLNKTLTASTRLMLTGDVMLGRGIDQILPHHCSPELYESCIKDARLYTQLAIQNNGELPAKRDHTYPWGFALQDIEHIKPDARIINLETAITTHPTPWPQKGINYRMHPQNIPTITAAGVDVCTLANNHTLDWCEPGFIETLNTLHSAGIATAGAGHNLQQAQAPAVIHLAQNKDTGTTARVLVWSIGHSSAGVPSTWQAKPDKPGVFYTNLAPDDVQKMKDLVAQHKRPGDIILCSCHWGSNWGYQIPDQQKSFAHELIDKCDIDIVHGHSSHHVKAAEVYKDKLIIYGCGDLISDYEGITNTSIEAYYPKSEYKDTLGVIWFPDIDSSTGKLLKLQVLPTRLKKLQLTQPSDDDLDFLKKVLYRECGQFGAKAVKESDEHNGCLEIQY